MKIALSAIGKFHTFDLARELYARGNLVGVATAYPRFKLKNEGIPPALVSTFPWVYAAYLAMPGKDKFPRRLTVDWLNLSAVSFGAWVAASLPDCDLYVGLSGSALTAGRKAKVRGAKFICDRGSSHIREQDDLLRAEHALWGVPYYGIDSRTIDREEAEYAEANAVSVPSQFVLRSFIKNGVPAKKMRLLPYGVNLTRFQPMDSPAEERFDVLFVGAMSLRKGVQYLVQAYKKVKHPAKSLTFVGVPSKSLMEMLASKGMWPEDARVLGHIPQTELKNLMSRSHVLVLPSIEEGLAMVQAQAMACGCPVIASLNTGCEDLYTDGVEGFAVPIRSVDALADRMQLLADQPEIRRLMAQRAIERVRSIGGWREYGENACRIYSEVIAA
jgi:starch synthase